MKNISRNQKYVLDIVKLVLACLSLMILLWVGKWVVRIFWFDTFIIPSCSMMPTLQPGDKIMQISFVLVQESIEIFISTRKG